MANGQLREDRVAAREGGRKKTSASPPHPNPPTRRLGGADERGGEIGPRLRVRRCRAEKDFARADGVVVVGKGGGAVDGVVVGEGGGAREVTVRAAHSDTYKSRRPTRNPRPTRFMDADGTRPINPSVVSVLFAFRGVETVENISVLGLENG